MLDKLLAKQREYQEEYEKALEYASYCKTKMEVLDDIIADFELDKVEEVLEETQPVEVTPTI